ncbi:MAG: alcohol dehydrogenase catalytic domain-containing protein [Actinobacteria bacterium]|nr:alcohol dehydrogenase catalytic domain-containing protein [Actinomycetota bacterium]
MGSTMRVVQLDFADAAFPASLVDAPVPDLPGPDWVRVDVAAGGICGSDLHLFNQATGPAQSLSGFVVLPMDLGHEIAGHVVEAGPTSGIAEGTAVAVDPVIACEARGIKPMCRHCANGRVSACHNFGSRVLTRGMGLGFTAGLGSGWADAVVAHRSMIHPLPVDLPVQNAALHEPLSIAIHGLMRTPPDNGDPVLIVGAGIIGLCAAAAVGALFPASPITILAKHDHQARAARALGAANVVMLADAGAHFDALADIVDTPVRGKGAGRMLARGFPYVVEAVGTESAVTDTLRLADGRGTVLLLGAAGISNVDLSPLWFKELSVVGSFCHASDNGTHSIDSALELLASNTLPPDLVITHTFPLDAYRDAVNVALDRGASAAIKVLLTP